MNYVKHRALIVEDDDQIVGIVAACVESLGHVSERAATQADAQAMLAAKPFCYVLLDLEIPLKPNGFSRIENGENLLERIAATSNGCGPKVIVMTSHGNKGHALAVQMMKKGAIDYVGKPFPSPPDQTLDDKIKEALGKHCRHAPGECPILAGAAAHKQEAPSVQPAGLTPFRGGKLIFHPEHVELLGRTILTAKGGKFSRPLLELLAKRTNGKYAAYTGNAVARELSCPKGQNDVAGYVKSLRRRIREALRSDGISCADQDVIMSGGPGYRLNPWITVEFHNG